MKVVDRMMELLKTETSISGDGLPMVDMIGNFSEFVLFLDFLKKSNKTWIVIFSTFFRIKAFDIELDGIVHFYNGFVMKIGKVTFLEPKYLDLSDSTKALIQTNVIFENVDVTYELDCELEEHEAISTQVLHFGGLEFFVSISKDHAATSPKPLIKFENVFGGIFKISIENVPSNPYNQIIAKEVFVMICT
jgi:hypothetical protein